MPPPTKPGKGRHEIAIFGNCSHTAPWRAPPVHAPACGLHCPTHMAQLGGTWGKPDEGGNDAANTKNCKPQFWENGLSRVRKLVATQHSAKPQGWPPCSPPPPLAQPPWWTMGPPHTPNCNSSGKAIAGWPRVSPAPASNWGQ